MIKLNIKKEDGALLHIRTWSNGNAGDVCHIGFGMEGGEESLFVDMDQYVNQRMILRKGDSITFEVT